MINPFTTRVLLQPLDTGFVIDLKKALEISVAVLWSERLQSKEWARGPVTQHPGQDHPLHSGRRRALTVGVRRRDMLRGQEEQEEEGQVRSRVADEFDEGLADE